MITRNRRGQGLITGIALGAIAAVACLSAWAVPPGTGVAGYDVIMSASPTGELGITPGPFLAVAGLGAGSPEGGPYLATEPVSADSPAVSSNLQIVNQTGSTLSVSLRALPAGRAADDALLITIQEGTRTAFSGTLGELRAWQADSFRTDPGAVTDLHFTVEVVPGAPGGMADIQIEFEANPR